MDTMAVENEGPQKRFFVLLVLINIIGLAAMALLSSIATGIAQAFTVSVGEIFYIQAATLIAMAVFTILWAYIADKFQRIKVLRVSIIIWSLFCFLTIFASNWMWLLILQILMVFGVAAIVPTTYSMTTDIVQKFGRSEAFGWLSMAQNLGSGFAFLLGGFLIDATDWTMPFIILAILGATGIPILIFKFDEPKCGVQETELCEVFEEEENYNYKISLKDLQMVLKPRSNFWIFTSGFISIFCTGAVGFVFVTMMQTDHTTSESLATIFLIIMFLPQILFPVLIGRFSDKLAEKNPLLLIKILIICTVIAAIGYIVGFLIPFTYSGGTLTTGSIASVVIFTIIMSISLGFASGIPPMLFSSLSYVNSPETRSTVYSLSNMTRTVGRGIGIAIVAYLADNVFGGVYSNPLVLSTIFLAISIILIVPTFRTYKRDIDELQKKLSKRASQILGKEDT